MQYWNDGVELYHYGIPGQKWGQRRFQNQDGSLTEEGRKRYSVGESVRNINRRRLKNAYEAASRDAQDLRKHGMNKEAKAVQSVANRNKQKLDKLNSKSEKIGNRIVRNRNINHAVKIVASIADSSITDPHTKESINNGQLIVNDIFAVSNAVDTYRYGKNYWK